MPVKMLKGYLVCQGLHPSGEGEADFKIEKRHVEHLQDRGHSEKYYELFSAADVLKSPAIIFEGLKRQRYEDGLCYIGKPKCYGDGTSYPGYHNMLFLVCVTKDLRIFEWG